MSKQVVQGQPLENKWTVPVRQKLVAFLQNKLGGGYSGKFLRKLLELNLCRVNGRIERFGSREVEAGSVVELAPNWITFLSDKPPAMQTLYDDENFLIANKPAGWVCTDDQTRETFGSNHFLVHRLDKTTTGLLIIAKSAKVRDELMELFEKREIHKSYWAVVDGNPKEAEGVKHTLFAKKGSFEGQTIWGSSSQGVTAITHWKVLAKGDKASLVLCEPVTGRTHQIRVHMMELGHPILIDRQYAKSFRCRKFVARPLLHAHRLQFTFREQKIDITAPLFDDMSGFLMEVGIDVRQLGESLSEKRHDHTRDNRDYYKDAEKVKKRVNPLHQRGKKPAGVKRNANANVPKTNAKRFKASGGKPGHHRKPNRGK